MITAGQPPTQLTLIDTEPLQVTRDNDDNEPFVDPAHRVLVRVLGHICVDGAARPLPAKNLALVAYLAVHGPADRSSLQDAVWHKLPADAESVAKRVSEIRKALGSSQHLPRADREGRYRLGDDVVCDLELFTRRLNHAKHQPHAQAVDTLRGALELVGGPPFTYRPAAAASFEWVDVGNWVSHAEALVAAAAHRLVTLALDTGAHDLAIWAARRGLDACPVQATLSEDLMRAYQAAGDTHAALRVYDEHLAGLARIDDMDEPDESIVTLAEQIRGRHPAGDRAAG